MRKVVLVSGSSRKGNTLGISKIYADELKKCGFQTQLIDLSEDAITFCDGCLECDDSQKCKKSDSMYVNIDAIRSADLLIIGTPTRWSLLSAELKCFIDRLNPYASIEGYAGINVFIFAVGQSGEENCNSIKNAINSLQLFTEDAGMKLIGTQAFCSLLDRDDYKKCIDLIDLACKSNVSKIDEVIKK